MACDVGSSPAMGCTEAGSALSGIIRPPTSIEGRKIACESSSVARLLAATTPINAPSAAKANAVSDRDPRDRAPVERQRAAEKRPGGHSDNRRGDQPVEKGRDDRRGQDRERRDAVDLEAAVDACLPRIHQRAGHPQQGAGDHREDRHGRQHRLFEERVDLRHHQPHHGVEAEREEVVDEEERRIAQAGLELEGKVVGKGGHFVPPLFVISRKRSSSDGRSTRRSTSLSPCALT